MKRTGGNELKYLTEVIENGFRSSKSSVMVNRLEKEFAEKFEAKFAISQVNGTATLHTILEAAGVGRGDEVIVPALTMASTAFAVLQANATPIFADVHPDTLVLDAKSVAARITSKTRAIITVALYGLSPEMDEINALARKHKLLVIEDNAQCFLGKYRGKLVGTLGDAASFSFQSSKHMTSGEGGMITTSRDDLANGLRRVSSLGYAAVSASQAKISKKTIQSPEYARHVSLGWNYRMSELCAAVALAQLERLDEFVEMRTKAAQAFQAAVEGCEWLVPQRIPAHCTSSFWTYVVQLENPKISWHTFRDRFLEKGGDGVYAAWRVNYLEPMFETKSFLGREHFISKENLDSYRPGLCPVAEKAQAKIFQFKTNYLETASAQKQAAILEETIRSFK